MQDLFFKESSWKIKSAMQVQLLDWIICATLHANV